MIRVAIYEDNAGLRDTLATIIRESDADFEMAGAFEDCLDIISNTATLAPDVIIMDIDLPLKSGIEGVREVKSSFPEVEIIMNTVFDDDDRIFRAIQAGATGYLLKKQSLSTLLTSIKEVKAGGSPMSLFIARRVLSLTRSSTSSKSNSFDLTEKEFLVLDLLSKGLSYKMIALECSMSIDTVRFYIKRIYEKLHVHSVTEAVHRVFIDKK
ncbi:MAG: response regulator transcription factor [Saprospiraceae bacterium]|nr:response regulator transcription factor [Candidatus Opimibacter iunctus]